MSVKGFVLCKDRSLEFYLMNDPEKFYLKIIKYCSFGITDVTVPIKNIVHTEDSEGNVKVIYSVCFGSFVTRIFITFVGDSVKVASELPFLSDETHFNFYDYEDAIEKVSEFSRFFWKNSCT